MGELPRLFTEIPMCFSAPKVPKVDNSAAEAAKARQLAQLEKEEARIEEEKAGTSKRRRRVAMGGTRSLIAYGTGRGFA